MVKKHWYEVTVSCSKTVRVFAENAEQARDKGEDKVNIKNRLWTAESVYREDNTYDDKWEAE